MLVFGRAGFGGVFQKWVEFQKLDKMIAGRVSFRVLFDTVLWENPRFSWCQLSRNSVLLCSDLLSAVDRLFGRGRIILNLKRMSAMCSFYVFAHFFKENARGAKEIIEQYN